MRGFQQLRAISGPCCLPVGAANPGCIAGVVDGLDDHTKDRESLAFDVVRLDGRDRRANQPVYILHRLVFRFDDAHFTFTIAPAVVIVAARSSGGFKTQTPALELSRAKRHVTGEWRP